MSDATTPAVVQDAQQYDWREDWNRVQTRIGYDEDAHVDAMHRLAAHIERLEPADDEVDGFYCLAEGHTHRNRYAEALCSARHQIRSLESERDALRKWKHDRTNTEHVSSFFPAAERDALLAEHEAQSAYNLAFVTPGTDGEEIDRLACAVFDAHDNAERVIRGE